MTSNLYSRRQENMCENEFQNTRLRRKKAT